MDMLTDAQLRVINEFRERVKQSEKRLRETIMNKDPRDSFQNISNNDISISNPDLSKLSEFRGDKQETPQRNFENKTTPYQDLGPQRMLKPVIFNGMSPYLQESQGSPLLSSNTFSTKQTELNKTMNEFGSGYQFENRPPSANNKPDPDYASLGRPQTRGSALKTDLTGNRIPSRESAKINETTSSAIRSPNANPMRYSLDFKSPKVQSYTDKVDAYLKQARQDQGHYTPVSPNHSVNRSGTVDPNYIYFLETKGQRLNVPSIRLFEFDRKDDRVNQTFDGYTRPNDRYSAFKDTGSFVNERASTSFDGFGYGIKSNEKVVKVRSPKKETALETFGSRRNQSSGKKSTQKSLSAKKSRQGNILAVDDYKVSFRGAPGTSHKEKREQRAASVNKRPSSAVIKRRDSAKPVRASVTGTPMAARTESKMNKSYIQVQRERERERELPDTDPKKMAKELLRRLRLGTVDQNKAVAILEDHMFFSTRFRENIRELLHEGPKPSFQRKQQSI